MSDLRTSKETGMYEVKADALEASFDAVVAEAALGELRQEMAALRGRMDAAAVQAGRPALTGAQPAETGAKAFVERYLRKGIEAGVELKSFSGAAPADGGYAVPKEIDERIDRTLKAISPIRAVASVVRVGTAGYRKLVTTGGVASGWVAETDARAETATPAFQEIAPAMGELYANPAASQAMLDDAAFDVEEWLGQEIATEFARAEGAAFVAGNGVNKPKGILSYPVSDAGDAARPFGTLQYLASGAAGAFAAGTAPDRLIDLVQSLRAPYRQNACWVMSAGTLAAIRKLKTADGQFLWAPGLAEGQADRLLGYPVIESGDMPEMAANSLAIAFGDFRAGYLVAERAETAILRDPFSHKPFVHFYAVKRVGGGVANSEAIKLMKFAAN